MNAKVFLLLALVGAVPKIMCQECPEELSFFESPGAGAMDIQGNILALGGQFRGINIIKISDQRYPQLMSQILTFGGDPCRGMVPMIYDVVFQNNFLFATYTCPDWGYASYSGIIVYDVSDPTSPLLAGNYFTLVIAGMAYSDMDMFESTAFIALQAWGLAVIDISDPTTPFQVWHDENIGDITKILVHYPWLYAIRDRYSFGSDLLIFDITNPKDPELNHILPYDYFPEDMAIEGNRLYLLQRADNYQGNLIIYDISDPLNPSILSQYLIQDAVGMRLDVRKGIVGINATHHNEEWPNEEGRLIVLDCRMPWAIRLLNNFTNEPIYAWDETGDALFYEQYFLVSGSDGFKLFDFSACFPKHARPLGKPKFE